MTDETLPAMCAKHEMVYGRYDPTCPDCREENDLHPIRD